MFWLLLLFQDSAINVSVSVKSVSFLPPSLLAFHRPHWRFESYCIHPATLLTEDRRLYSSRRNRRYSIWLSFWMTFFIWNSLRGTDCFGFPLLVSGWRNRIAVPVMGFSLPSTTSANDWEGKWRGEGEKNKTHPTSIGHFKSSHCLINTNMPWQTQARPDSLNYNGKTENLRTSEPDNEATLRENCTFGIQVYNLANLPWR